MPKIVQTGTEKSGSPGKEGVANINGFFVPDTDSIPIFFVGIESRLRDQVQHGLVGIFRCIGAADWFEWLV